MVQALRRNCWLVVGALSLLSACGDDATQQSEMPLSTGGMTGGTFATGGGLAPLTGGTGVAAPTAGSMAPIGGMGGGGAAGAMSGGAGGAGGASTGGAGGAIAGGAGGGGGMNPEPCMPGDESCESPDAGPDEELCVVQPITDALRAIHSDVYTRFAAARGVPALATDSPEDEALRRACMLLHDLGQNPDVLEVMLEENIGLVVMGVDETSADFPEFAAWGVPDSRARGLGGVPRGLCAEENILCDRSVDRWRGESICVHEFGHTMHLGVYNKMDSTFMDRVDDAFRAARNAGKYANTYAASNSVEYFGEGVQNWYNTNIESIPANGVHNEINTRSEMQEYDPALYEILAEVLPDEPSYKDCYYYED